MNSRKLSSFCTITRDAYDVVVDVDANDEIQTRVPSVDHLVLAVLDERALHFKHTDLTWFSVRERHLRMSSPSVVMRSWTLKLL